MLPDDETTLRHTLALYEPMASDWLATRIIARATALQQKQGIVGHLARAFSDWRYALPAKGAALAAFAMLGMLGAQLDGSGHLDPDSVIGDPSWTEQL